MSSVVMNSAVPRKLPRPYAAMLVIGVISLIIGGALSPARVWANLMLMAWLLVGMGLAGLLFLAFTRITGARWSHSVRPIAESLGRTLPYSAAALGVVILAGLGNYPWMHEDMTGHRPTYWFKAAWLEPKFFAVRTVLYLLIWTVLAALIAGGRRRSQEQARDGSLLPGLFLAAFALTFWLATTDWIMSLEPHWYSTIFAVYHFAGVFSGGLAAITLLVAWPSRREPASASGDTLHSLGSLLLGFSCFWMYIWFCQYMLIWYTNFPEESAYYVLRTQGMWQPLFQLNLVLNWGIPFFVLLPRSTKRNPQTLIKVAAVMVVGRWLDLYLAITPPAVGTPAMGFAEMGGLAAGVGIAAWLLTRTSPVRTTPVAALAVPSTAEPAHEEAVFT